MTYPDPNQPHPQQQPPPHGGYVPPPFPPAPPAKKRKPLLIALAAAGVAGALCCVGGMVAVAVNGDSVKPAAQATQTGATQAALATTADPASAAPPATEAAKPAAPPPAPAPPKEPGIGQPVRDGKFEFTVTGMKCGVQQVGGGFMNKKAQGQFCLIDVTVKNIGKEAQTFHGSAQKAMDAAGVEFSNDGAAEMYANEDSSTFLNEINPGNGAKGRLVFDVAKGTKLTLVELHDSMFSGGVKVRLAK